MYVFRSLILALQDESYAIRNMNKTNKHLLSIYYMLSGFGKGVLDIKSYLIFTAIWWGKSHYPYFCQWRNRGSEKKLTWGHKPRKQQSWGCWDLDPILSWLQRSLSFHCIMLNQSFYWAKYLWFTLSLHHRYEPFEKFVQVFKQRLL